MITESEDESRDDKKTAATELRCHPSVHVPLRSGVRCHLSNAMGILDQLWCPSNTNLLAGAVSLLHDGD